MGQFSRRLVLGAKGLSAELRRARVVALAAGLVVIGWGGGAGLTGVAMGSGLGEPLAAPAAQGGEKKKVTTVDDLPRHTYDIKGSALKLVKNKAAILALAGKVKADAEADLAGYDIEDRTVLEAYERLLQQIDILNGRWDAAVARIPKLRELAAQEDDKLMSGMTLRAHVAAMKAAATPSGAINKAKYTEAFKRELREMIRPLPLEPILERLQKARASAKMVSREQIESGLDEQLDPLITANPGKVPQEVAVSLITTRWLFDFGLDVIGPVSEVYGEFVDGTVPEPEASVASADGKGAVAGGAGGAGGAAPVVKGTKAEKVDIWTPTLVTLEKDAKAKPVVVAIWDTGVDTTLFPGQLWTNGAEKVGAKDADHNGFVDDVHGIAFTTDHKPASGDLYPLEALKTDKATLMAYVEASMEMSAGVESPAVDALRKHVVALRGKEIKEFSQDMGIIGNYAHGTHVAGIVAAGNPFVRLLPIRETFPYKEIPDAAPTLEEYQRWGQATQTAVNYARAAGARVVNMSWRIPRAAVEQQLAIKGVGKTPAERAELSRQIFAAFKDGLQKAIAGAPDILFVAGAGNEGNDADFSEYVPAGLKLPNLLTVSAVDCYGKPTNFTTTGKSIDLYANGYQIDSLVPGGQHMKFSGTSMSSPQVANLAAKLIALKPELTVAETIELIRKGASPLPGKPGRFIINPAASVKLLQAR